VTRQDPAKVLEAWARQLAADVAPYVSVATSRGHGVQVVLFLGADGKVGSPKVTVTTKGPD